MPYRFRKNGVDCFGCVACKRAKPITERLGEEEIEALTLLGIWERMYAFASTLCAACRATILPQTL